MCRKARRLPVDVEYRLKVARMLVLEEQLRGTNGFLEPERWLAIVEELGQSYREVMKRWEWMGPSTGSGTGETE